MSARDSASTVGRTPTDLATAKLGRRHSRPRSRRFLIGTTLFGLLASGCDAEQATPPPASLSGPARATAKIRPRTAAPSKTPAPSKVVKVADGFKFLEGPIATADGNLLFADVLGNRIYRVDTASDGVELWRDLPGGPSGLTVAPDGTVFAALAKIPGVDALRFDEREQLAAEGKGAPFNGPNDIVIDDAGGLYFSDPYYGKSREETNAELVYYLSPGGTPAAVVSDLKRPNGLLLANDGTRLYVGDHAAGQVVYYPVEAPGVLGPRTEFASGLKKPDGLTRDRYDNIYVATGKGILVFDHKGKKLQTIKTPNKPSNCAFAGRDGTLYVTTKKALYRVDVPRAKKKKKRKPKEQRLTKKQKYAASDFFAKRCVACHGSGGAGDGPAAATFETPPPSFASAAWQSAMTDAAISRSILRGGAERGGGAMPAFPELKNDPPALRALIAKVRSFGTKETP